MDDIDKANLLSDVQVAAESRLESRRDPLFEEPSRVVVFDLAFVREKFFDLQSGALIEKVSSILEHSFL